MRRVKKWKWIEEPSVKHPTPSQAVDVIIGEEEQDRKQKITKKKKRNRERVPSPTTRNYPVTPYDA